MLTYTLIAAFLIMIASLSGVLFAWHGFRSFIEKNSAILTTFALGVFSVTAASLVVESWHGNLSLWVIAFWFAFGALTIEILIRLIPDAHHHHDTLHHHHKHSRLDAKRMLMGDAIHNIGDGILLVPAFLIDIRVGLITTLGIFLHELVQEIAEFFVLKEAGYSTKRALLSNFIVSSTILIGIAVSIAIAQIGDYTAALLAVAAGGFIYIILRDFLPHTIRSVRHTKRTTSHIIAGLSGALIILAIIAFSPHDHGSHESHEHDDHKLLQHNDTTHQELSSDHDDHEAHEHNNYELLQHDNNAHQELSPSDHLDHSEDMHSTIQDDHSH